MSFLSALFFCLLVLSLLFFILVLKSGNPLFDLARLPYYWYRVILARQGFAQTEKMKYGSHPAQYHLYIAPPCPPKINQPAIVYIHGGGWQFSKPQHFITHGEVLAQAGYPVYLMSHRKVPFNSVLQMREDLHLGLAECRKDIVSRGLGGRKIIIGGMSSGGNLAALQFLAPESKETIIAGFFQSAPLDLDQMPFTPPIWLFAGRRNKPGYALANPVKFLDAGDERPVLISHGLKDGIVTPKVSISFFKSRTQFAPYNTKLILWSSGNHFHSSSWAYDSGSVRSDLMEWLDSCW